MTKHAPWFGGLAASIVAVLVTCGVSFAQSPLTAATPGSSMGADIKVHGHWTIEVRNPDGTLASHNEFENALLNGGRSALSALLGKTATSFEWRLLLGDGICQDASGPTFCVILEPQPIDPTDVQFAFPNLALAPTQAGTLELQGHFTAFNAGTVSQVDSQFLINGGGGGAYGFSQRILSTPIQVAAGQQVYVKVTFSFS